MVPGGSGKSNKSLPLTFVDDFDHRMSTTNKVLLHRMAESMPNGTFLQEEKELPRTSFVRMHLQRSDTICSIIKCRPSEIYFGNVGTPKNYLSSWLHIDSTPNSGHSSSVVVIYIRYIRYGTSLYVLQPPMDSGVDGLDLQKLSSKHATILLFY